MEDKIKYLFEDLWKGELTKTGKFELEQQVRLLARYKNAFEELLNFYKNDLQSMQSKSDQMVFGRLKGLIKKYNLGGE